MDDDDPGWRLSPRMLLMLVPFMGSLLLRSGRGPGNDGLDGLRQVWTSFVASAVLFGVVLLLVVPKDIDRAPAGPGVAALVVIAAACFAVVPIVERPLRGDDATALAESYRTRFFLRTAFAQAPALFAFIAVFLVNQVWVYWVILPLAIAAYVRNAPTSGHLERDQWNLSQRGCDVSLVRALRGIAQ
jgi:hypothetical protein